MSEASCTLINNSNGESALDRLAALCDGAETLSLAVGYLFVEGLAPLLPKIEKLQRVQLLIGNVVNRLTEEQIFEAQLDRNLNTAGGPDEMFAKGLREERDRSAVETALNLRRTIDAMPHTDANREVIIDLATYIARGTVQVRLLTNHRLHAKAAILTYPSWHEKAEGAGIVGSSNLTLARWQTGKPLRGKWSADLDVQIEGRENVAFLSDWFGAHWAEAQDFQKELFEELGRSWPLQTTAS